jgi:hypothetical protein
MTKWELGEEFGAYKMARESYHLTYTQWLEEMAMRYLDPPGNARQPEANMLDLGGLERFDFKSRDYTYADMVRSHDGAWIRYSDLTNAEVPIPTVEELAEAMYQNNTALLTNVEARYIAKVVHKLLTKGRGGA